MASLPFTFFTTFIGSAMISPMESLGFSDVNGSWKIICMLVCIFFICFLSYFKMSSPSYSTSPSVASTSRIIVLPSVDFPHPDSPTMPSVCPSFMVRFTSSTACRRPRGVWKYFFRFLVSIKGAAMITVPLSFHRGSSGCCGRHPRTASALLSGTVRCSADSAPRICSLPEG